MLAGGAVDWDRCCGEGDAVGDLLLLLLVGLRRDGAGGGVGDGCVGHWCVWAVREWGAW